VPEPIVRWIVAENYWSDILTVSFTSFGTRHGLHSLVIHTEKGIENNHRIIAAIPQQLTLEPTIVFPRNDI
jgi:hypothetical protein